MLYILFYRNCLNYIVLQIDFVAHDDIPYMTEDGSDVYAKLKAKGMFVATQRS